MIESGSETKGKTQVFLTEVEMSGKGTLTLDGLMLRQLFDAIGNERLQCKFCGTKAPLVFHARPGHDSVMMPLTRDEWRVVELRPHLLELASLPNVRAWWSEDRDTGSAILPVGRWCFLCVDAEDETLVPPGVDLVSRQDTRAVKKWANGAWVCPKENGTRAGDHLLVLHAVPAARPGPARDETE
jgi:hypothetical protein